MSKSAVAIRLERCAKTFSDGTRALDPLDLAVAPGETVVFLGPSGCGKTTTLRIIAGLEFPDRGGRVLYDDEEVTRVPIERRHVGMVFQSYALFPHLDVRDNVAYGLKVRGIGASERERRVDEMLALMRIEALATRSVDQLSGGQRQRVALARALAVRPRALLLDEPLTALDAKLRDTLRLEIDALLRGLGITTVYVTHDQTEAMSLGDRIVVMDHGRVAQVGTPAEIYHHPATPFVADFVGIMNRLPGKLSDGGFASTAGVIPWPDAPAGVAEVLFRPEAARLVAAPAAHLTAVVSAVFFLGDRTRLFLDTGSDRPVVVETTERRHFARGDRVHLAVDPRGLLALGGMS